MNDEHQPNNGETTTFSFIQRNVMNIVGVSRRILKHSVTQTKNWKVDYHSQTRLRDLWFGSDLHLCVDITIAPHHCDCIPLRPR